MWENEVLKAFLLRHRFDLVLIYIGHLNENIARSSGVLGRTTSWSPKSNVLTAPKMRLLQCEK